MLEQRHVLITGPKGTGKTTLMYMAALGAAPPPNAPIQSKPTTSKRGLVEVTRRFSNNAPVVFSEQNVVVTVYDVGDVEKNPGLVRQLDGVVVLVTPDRPDWDVPAAVSHLPVVKCLRINDDQVNDAIGAERDMKAIIKNKRTAQSVLHAVLSRLDERGPARPS